METVYQSLVSFDKWTFIAQILNLFLQLYLFKRFLFKPVRDIIAKRQEEVSKVYESAEIANADAEKAKESYEQSLSNARAEAEEITSKAVASAQLQSKQILDDANKTAANIKSKAEADIELDRQKAMLSAKGEISKMAVEIASKLALKEIDEEAHNALIDQFIEELGD